jgi:hypothetical protein
MFAGRVGTGFSEKLLASIDAQLRKIRDATCPFINFAGEVLRQMGPRNNQRR